MVWDGLSGRVPDKDGSHHNAWQDARMAILGSHQGVVHLSYRAERWRPRALCCALCFGVVGTPWPMFRSPAFVAPPLPRSYYWGWGEQSQRAIHFFQNRDGKQLNCRDKIEDMFSSNFIGVLIFHNYWWNDKYPANDSVEERQMMIMIWEMGSVVQFASELRMNAFVTHWLLLSSRGTIVLLISQNGKV